MIEVKKERQTEDLSVSELFSDRHLKFQIFKESIKDLRDTSNNIHVEFITNPENCTIEHICPQDFLKSPSWAYLKKEDIDFTPNMTHDIGNLVFLTRNDNSKNNAGDNLSFRKRKKFMSNLHFIPQDI